MSDPIPDSTMALGLLMEGAQAHQRMAESGLEQLRAHAQGLDEVVRDEIRRTLTDELASLHAEIGRSIESFSALRRAASWRTAWFSLAVSALCGVLPITGAYLILPSPREVASLKAERDRLNASIALLQLQGGGLELGRCGKPARPCVRIDPQAARFGEDADFAVLHGR